MDILCAEEEILSLFHYMGHVVVGAVAPVANVNILPARKRSVPVHNIAECAEFVFFMHGLKDSVRINVCIKIKKGIYVHTVDASGGVSGGAEILRGSQLRTAEKSGCGSVGGKVAVSVICGREARLSADGSIEMRKDAFQCFGLEFRAPLVQCGKGWHFLVQSPKIQHLHPGGFNAFLVQHGYDKKMRAGTKSISQDASWQEIADKISSY